MSTAGLRQLRVSEILDVGVRLYLRNAGTMLALTATFVVPVQILAFVVDVLVVKHPQGVPGDPLALGTTAHVSGWASLSGDALGRVGATLGAVACVSAASDSYLGRTVDSRGSLRFTLGRIGVIVWLAVLTTLGLVVAFIALVAPGIFLFAAWSVAIPVLVVEGLGARASLGRSYALTTRRWWPVAAVAIAAFLMAFIVQEALVILVLAVIGRGPTVVGSAAITTAADTLGLIVGGPLLAAIATVLYYDLYARHQESDAAVRAKQAAQVAPAAARAGEQTRVDPRQTPVVDSEQTAAVGSERTRDPAMARRARRIRMIAVPVALVVALVLVGRFAGGGGTTPGSFGNFAGYSWFGRVSSVQASWIVPRILPSSPRNASAATWISAQTPGSGPFIQIGINEWVEQYPNHRPRLDYFAFWSDTKRRFLDQPLFDVSPGDTVSAALKLENGQWILGIFDETSGTNAYFSTSEDARGSFNDASWLQEHVVGFPRQHFPYPRLSAVAFRGLEVNATPPAAGALCQVWMSEHGHTLLPTPVRSDSFILQYMTAVGPAPNC